MFVGADAELLHHVGHLFVAPPSQHIGVAVSGGSDSMALLDLLDRWTKNRGLRLSAATVDHGLRVGAAAEAAQVAVFCASRDIAHQTLRWVCHSPGGNMQDKARTARYGLLAEWAKGQRVEQVALGHTQEDQAETFLMRLAREAGVDGLAGMPAGFKRHGMRWSRPLLDVSRLRLRSYLTGRGIAWSDDPSNEDGSYERIKARRVLATLEPLGIDAGMLRRVAFQLEDSSVTLKRLTRDLARDFVTEDRGDIVLNWTRVNAQSFEISRRLLIAALKWVSVAIYSPRRDHIQRVLMMIETTVRQTLAGCVVDYKDGHVRITREYNAVKSEVAPTDAVWDKRWVFDGPHASGQEIRALGEAGLRLCPNWRETGLPRTSLLASPAVWQGETLIAAPLAGFNDAWTARIVTDFHTSLLSH